MIDPRLVEIPQSLIDDLTEDIARKYLVFPLSDDGQRLTKELWNSKQNPERDDVGIFAKFCPFTVANGKIYMASFSGYLTVYGLQETSSR